MKKKTENTIEIKNLCKNYGSILAANNINFSAQKGEIIALLGPNGAGKSTLINMIAGYLAPTSGQIKIMDKDIAKFPIFAKSQIGFLPEGSPIYADMSVKMFLGYMAHLCGTDKKEVTKVAKIAKIEEVMTQKVDTLSKGYLRRVGFAQSILGNPPILLLDEPTDGLDPNQKEHMRRLIVEMAQDKTIIISTHLLEEAQSICSRILLIDKGKIKADGSLKQILQSANAKDLATAFRQLTTVEENN